MLALIGLISIRSWLQSDDGQIGSSRQPEPSEATHGPAEPDTTAARPAPESVPGPAAEEALVLAEPVTPPNTMREYLLSTPDANRNRILRLAVTSEGYECGSVRSARLVGNSGADWRTHCGDSEVYWVVVDELSQFSVVPMPYGDVDIPVPVRVMAPESTAPPVQQRRQDFERRQQLQPVEPPDTR